MRWWFLILGVGDEFHRLGECFEAFVDGHCF
jgi:hypothetical protein